MPTSQLLLYDGLTLTLLCWFKFLVLATGASCTWTCEGQQCIYEFGKIR